jgi:hypothetical protein
MRTPPSATTSQGSARRNGWGKCLSVTALLASLAVIPRAPATGLPEGILIPAVPDVLKVSPTEEPILMAKAQGVQIYECRAKKADPTQFEWAFIGPEADLFDSQGNRIGHHFAGPTWELDDGSRVVGSVRASVASRDPGAVPWLLVGAKDHAGTGILSRVTSIQRLETSRGKAPPGGCSQANVGERLRVPYTAVYYFYVPKA